MGGREGGILEGSGGAGREGEARLVEGGDGKNEG